MDGRHPLQHRVDQGLDDPQRVIRRQAVFDIEKEGRTISFSGPRMPHPSAELGFSILQHPKALFDSIFTLRFSAAC